MSFIINLAFLFFITITPLAGGATPPPQQLQHEPHDFVAHGLECRSCHISVGLLMRGSMQKPIGDICAGCHKLAEQTSHPVGMKPSFPLPAGLPLDEKGIMTCATCHDPHRPYLNALTGEKTLYLRRDGPRKMFCIACHNK